MTVTREISCSGQIAITRLSSFCSLVLDESAEFLQPLGSLVAKDVAVYRRYHSRTNFRITRLVGGMLDSLALSNFRGFSNHVVQFRPLSIIVGRNNAGKSTIVEALRLVSIVTSRYRGFNYHAPPDWLDEPKYLFGASPDVRGLELHTQAVFYQYGGPPGLIEG